jgi:subtilase family serine protease
VIRKLVFLLAIVAIVSGATIVSQAQPKTLSTRHQRQETLNGRTPLVGHLPSQTMHLQLILQHRNQAGLEQFLKEQHDPSSPNYRKVLTVEQFTELYGPSREDYAAVKNFARQNGLQVISGSPNRMLIQVRGSVENVEKALHVSMNVYQHDLESRTFFAPDREPTPDLPFQLWHVGGLDNYATPKPMFTKRDPSTVQADGVISNATTGSCPGASFCGSDMRAAYYTSQGGTLTGTGQSLGLFEFLGTDLVDLTTYFTNAGQTDNVPVTLTSVDTQNTLCKEPSCDDTEQTLDMTQAISMAPGMSSLVMWIGTGGLSGQTLDDPGILNGMATASPLNAQLSCSWAWKPTDNTTDDPFFQEFSAQGQNFFDATGDSGNWAHASFVWPADDPYITGVGGTDLTTTGAGGAWSTETGWVDGGGGISTNKFAIPSWQVTAAAGCAKCSQTLRNGPDVSANANFTFYVCADQTSCTENLYGGTSFAAPMWAGFMALVNQQALLNGNPTLSFVNPALYAAYSSSSYDSDFHDILTGGNTLGATVGYDLATGIGSPQAALVDVLAGAPAAGFTLSASPNAVSVVQGNSGTSTITSTTTGGFNSAVTLSASGQPTGVTVTFNPTSITGTGTSTMTMAVSASTVAGVYPITVTGTSGSTTETTTVTLTVTASSTGSFTLAMGKPTLSVAPGSQTADKVTATPSGGFTGTIALSASGQPTGVTVHFNPASIAGGSGSATVQVRVANTTKAGTYTITIKGTSGSTTATTTITLTVT